MNFGPKRGHVLFIFENFVKDFGLLIAALLIGLISGDMEVITENIVVMVIVFVGPIGRIVQYFFTYYTVDDEKLTVKSGFLTKNTLEVPISTITTVDFSQNILHQIFGAYRLNVDNASNVSKQQTKIRMTFSEKDALLVRDLLIRGRKGLDGMNLAAEEGETEGDKRTYKAEAKDLILLGAIKSKGIFLLEFIGAFSTLIALFNFSDAFIYSAIAELFRKLELGWFILLVTAVFFFIAVLCGMIGTVVRYFGFQVMDNGEALKIEYGLLTKKRYTIQKKKISGFSYHQSFLMKRLKTGTLQLYAIGYGGGSDEESREDPILFPLIKEERLRKAMKEILPQMEEVSEYTGTAKGALPYFFLSFSFFFTLALFVAALLVTDEKYCGELWIPALLLVVFCAVGRVLRCRNTAVYGNEQNISMSFGGFKKTTIFVKTDHVESVCRQGGILKLRKGMVNVTIGYIAPLSSANQTVKNVPREVFSSIKKNLIY